MMAKEMKVFSTGTITSHDIEKEEEIDDRSWIFRLLDRLPPLVLLIPAVLCGAAGSSVVKKLVNIGMNGANKVDGRDAISVCNVLFIGYLASLPMFGSLYYKDWTVDKLRKLTWKDWVAMTVGGVLFGCVVPALLFTAIAVPTPVINIVLITRTEPTFFLICSRIFLKVPINWKVAGVAQGMCLVGIVLAFLFPLFSGGVVFSGFPLGEIQALIASIVIAISGTVSKKFLAGIPLGVFLIYRTMVGMIAFFGTALVLYGSKHFMDAFSPPVWRWVVAYAAVFVVCQQLLWFTGLRGGSPTEISVASSCNLPSAMLFAFIIVSEPPLTGQYVGASLMMLSVFYSQYMGWRARQAEAKNDKTKSLLDGGMDLVLEVSLSPQTKPGRRSTVSRRPGDLIAYDTAPGAAGLIAE